MQNDCMHDQGCLDARQAKRVVRKIKQCQKNLDAMLCIYIPHLLCPP